MNRQEIIELLTKARSNDNVPALLSPGGVHCHYCDWYMSGEDISVLATELRLHMGNQHICTRCSGDDCTCGHPMPVVDGVVDSATPNDD